MKNGMGKDFLFPNTLDRSNLISQITRFVKYIFTS